MYEELEVRRIFGGLTGI